MELPVTFGLGSTETVDGLTIRWPGGGVTDAEIDTVDTTVTIVQDG